VSSQPGPAPQMPRVVWTRARAFLARQPRPVGGVFLFCAFMTFVYMPYDVLVKPFTQALADAEEVWFGYMLRGTAAKLTEPLHWAIYAALTLGFYRERPWVWPCAALYTLQVSVASFVWSVLYGSYGPLGMLASVGVSLLFVALARAIWRARPSVEAAL